MSAIKILMQRHGLGPRRRLGQNFLVDQRVLDQIVAAVKPKPDEFILEIGPGLGALTRAMAMSGARVHAIEIDAGLVQLLAETLSDLPSVTVQHNDIMAVDLRRLLGAALTPGLQAKVAANLPYYITTPILFRLLEADLPISRMVVMVQREVAARLVATPGSKDYGALSIAVQFYSVPTIVTSVARAAFWPVPAVESAVVALTMLAKPPVDCPRQDLLRVVRAAFGQRRKTLMNALSHGLALHKDHVRGIAQMAGIDAQRRGETLSLEEFAALARAVTARAQERE